VTKGIQRSKKKKDLKNTGVGGGGVSWTTAKPRDFQIEGKKKRLPQSDDARTRNSTGQGGKKAEEKGVRNKKKGPHVMIQYDHIRGGKDSWGRPRTTVATKNKKT